MSLTTSTGNTGRRFATIEDVGVVAGRVGAEVYKQIAAQHAEQMARLESHCVERIAEAEVRIARAFEARLQALIADIQSGAVMG